MSRRDETRTTIRDDDEGSPGGRLCLFVVAGKAPGRHRLPDSGTIVLGRSTDADVVLPDLGVSRRHARVHVGPPLVIEDLGSSNGTIVCGRRLEPREKKELSEGDVVQLAKATILVQRVHDTDRPRVSLEELLQRLDELCVGATPCTLALLAIAGGGEHVIGDVLVEAEAIAAAGDREHAALFVGADPATVARAIDRLSRAGLGVQASTAEYPRDGRDAASLLARARAGLGAPDRRPVATGASMHTVRELAGRVARSELSVLIVGETGVGKEVLADLVHRSSDRATGPFLCLNCAALPEALLESELFGHEKGAFTGANHTKPGLLEVARGGTVFLDEVGELPPPLQAKLLRVLESREIRRVGGLEPRPIDVRFVAATNRELDSLREDLLYRLGGITIQIPPLRERRAEIPELSRELVEEACRRANRAPAPTWSAEALDRLLRHTWPGNIRELRNVAERAVVLCTGDVLDVEHLPEELGLAHGTGPQPSGEEARLKSQLEALDRRRVVEALERSRGNQSQAARILGIARNTLIARMKMYGLSPRTRG